MTVKYNLYPKPKTKAKAANVNSNARRRFGAGRCAGGRR